MSETSPHKPYSALGSRLKTLRQKLQETLAEVSGAVEIDTDVLTRIEQGEQCPSEAVLLLLITHFGIREDEADGLWELAGFDRPKLHGSDFISDADDQIKPMVMITAADARIVYTDIIHVMANNYGVVLNFMQTNGPGIRPLAVARVGMSKEHARSVLEMLQKTLTQNEPKALPLPKSRSKKQAKD